MPGILYIVATPIGNLADITHRAIDVLQQVDVIAAENTRHSRRLLQHFNISKRLIALHEHNEQQQSTLLLKRIAQGESIALISDAGTPLISDPGYRIVQQAHAESIQVVPIPGPSALIAALSAAGLPTDKFLFNGFLPVKSIARQDYLTSLQQVTHTLIFYEAPHRIIATMSDMITVFGSQRQAVIARELTKTFETIYQAPLDQLLQWLIADTHQQKGEFVVLVHGYTNIAKEEMNVQTQNMLIILAKELPLKQAAKLTAEITGEKKNMLYKWAIAQQNKH